MTGSTRTYTNAGSQIVESTAQLYNYDGIRVRTTSHVIVNGAAQSASTNLFLVDPYNRTGYPQVLEELPAVGAAPSVSYTIGDDIIAQSTAPTGEGAYFLKDGHDSVRQLASSVSTVTDYYGYDAYGIMLGGNPTPANPSTTKMLYSGEQYDSMLNLYNLRARFYQPGTGTFMSMDPYAGSPRDPQSLHKYAYCQGNPVNASDPSGMDGSLAETLTTLAIIAVVLSIASVGMMMALGAAFNNDAWPDAALWGVGVSISGPVVGPFVAEAISGAATALDGFTDTPDALRHFLGNALAAAPLGFAEAGGAGTGNFGGEMLASMRDGMISKWVWFGPGLGATPGSTSPFSLGSVGFSVQLYAGVCWNVKNYADYSGPFLSLSTSAGAGWLGFSVNWFMGVTNPSQFGTSIGIVIGPGQETGKDSFGLSYVTYKCLDTYAFEGTALFYAIWPLGIGRPMYYKWIDSKSKNFPGAVK